MTLGHLFRSKPSETFNIRIAPRISECEQHSIWECDPKIVFHPPLN